MSRLKTNNEYIKTNKVDNENSPEFFKEFGIKVKTNSLNLKEFYSLDGGSINTIYCLIRKIESTTSKLVLWTQDGACSVTNLSNWLISLMRN